MDKKANRVIFVLSIIGILIAIYVLQSFVRGTSIVCVNSGCETVRKSTAAYILGVPVPAFGLVGYSILAILSFLRTTSKDKRLLMGILGIAAGGFLFVLWFTMTEIFIIRAICTWCAISAGMMTVIFILALKSYLGENKKIK